MNEIIRFIKLNKGLAYKISNIPFILFASVVFANELFENKMPLQNIYLFLLLYAFTLFVIITANKFVWSYLFRFNKSVGFPIPRKRYTKLETPNIISIDEDDLQEVIRFVFEIENFIEDNNLKYRGK